MESFTRCSYFILSFLEESRRVLSKGMVKCGLCFQRMTLAVMWRWDFNQGDLLPTTEDGIWIG